jgi:hypothetical protein
MTGEDELPDFGMHSATVITSEFTSAAIRYIAQLERTVEETVAWGTAAHMAMFGLEPEDARIRFLDGNGRGDDLWPELDRQRDVYQNLLKVMAEEVRKWEAEKHAE